MSDFETIEYIRDEMIKDGVSEKFAYNISFLANDNDEAFQLLLQWMRAVDATEKQYLENKMQSMLDMYNRDY